MSDITWTTEQRKLGDLVEWTKNPRRLSKHDAEHLKKSLEKFGIVDPLIINADNALIGGHQRKHVLQAARMLGADAVIDVRVPSRQLDEREAEELAIRLNKNAGEWDFDLLANGFDVPDLLEWGFTAEELNIEQEPEGEDPGAQVDKAEELREKWGVESGQLWRLGEHRLICGDCTDRATVERVMGGEKASLIVTDPPYGVDYEGGANNEIKREKLRGDNDTRLYSEFLQVAPIADRCAMYLWHAGRRARDVYQAVMDAGFDVRSQIIWHKLNAHYGAYMAQYKQKHEPCIYCVLNAPEFSGATNEVTVWEYDQPSKNEHHPTEKPLDLFERSIKNHPYEIVYDPFLGSGTTLIACERLGRKCRAIEISPAYVAVAIQRWVDMTGGIPELQESSRNGES